MVEAPANTGALENPVLCKHKDAITSLCQRAWDNLSPEMIKEVNDQTVHFLPEDNQRVKKSSDQEQHMLAVPSMCHSSKSQIACMVKISVILNSCIGLDFSYRSLVLPQNYLWKMDVISRTLSKFGLTDLDLFLFK